MAEKTTLSPPQSGRRKIGKKRARWHDPQGKQLTAGGILPYTEDGIWVIGETKGNKIVWTDMGGKYEPEDCNIYATISREANEELYHSVHITPENIKNISETHNEVYVMDTNGEPVYICYVVSANILKKMKIYFNRDKFLENRSETLSQNPTVHNFYVSVDLKHITFEEIKKEIDNNNVSFRLKKILERGPLSHKIGDKFDEMFSELKLDK